MSEFPDGQLLTPAEASAVLGVHRVTLRRLAARGKLHPCRTAGGHNRYRAEEIEALRVEREGGGS